MKPLDVLKVGYNLKMIASILLEMKAENLGLKQLITATIWMPIWLKFIMKKPKHFCQIMLLNFQKLAGGWVPQIRQR